MPDSEYTPLIERSRQAAESHGVLIRSDPPETPPETVEGVVADIINMEYIAEDADTGETARGESLKAAWANLRGISKREVHNKMARHDP